MKNNIMRYYTLLCAVSMLVSASCSGSNTKEDPHKLKTLSTEPSVLSLSVGETARLTAKGTPATASLDNLRWSSRDTQTATVEEGTVTAVAAGTTTIVATCDGVSATCEVSVTEASTVLKQVKLLPAAVALRKGETADIQAALIPENAEVEGSIVWASSNADAATVDLNGRVTGVADGIALITATLDGISGTCGVEVYSHEASRSFGFLQLNLWEGLGNVDNGLDALIKHLVELRPDAASFCEMSSRAESESLLSSAAAALLENTGIPYYYTYYSGRGLLTRHPVISTGAVNGNEWFYRTVVDFYGQEIALYASHSYYLYYACYLPRGYGDGRPPYGWDKIPTGPITDVAYILEREKLSGRTQIAVDLAADSEAQHAAGRLCIFGGDLNQPSHLDWTEALKDSYEHNGCVVAWPVSTACYDGGLRDAFREIYPDPATHPGVTWPVYNEDAKKYTQWTDDADERDRIDFIYFRPEANFEAASARMVGPSAMVAKGLKQEDAFVDKTSELIEPVGGVWPSDHRGLLITFNVGFN